MSKPISPAFHTVIDEWHASDLDDKRIAALEAALARYDQLGPQLMAIEADVRTAIDELAAKVTAGDLDLADGLDEWLHRSAGSQTNVLTGTTSIRMFYEHCRRHARKAIEAAAAKIDWHTVIADATEELRTAIRHAGLVS